MPTHRRVPRSLRALTNRRLLAAAVGAGVLGMAVMGGSAVAANAAESARAVGTQAAALAAPTTDSHKAKAAVAKLGASAAAPTVAVGAPAPAPAAPAPVAPAPVAPAPVAPAPAAPVAAPAPPAPAAPALPAISGLTANQVANAATIVNVGKQMHVGARGEAIAIATALQESKLTNLHTAVDHDSLGLFQQRPSSGWGTPTQLTTPSYAAHAFYKSLVRNTSDYGCLTCAAQRVQGSAFPSAYAKWEGLATRTVAALNG